MEMVDEGERLFINGHMSKANPLWKTFETNAEVLVIFQGAHTYISPTWYNHVNVPTWNYQVVHLYGSPRIVKGEEYYAMISRLIAKHESGTNYRLETLPQDFVEKQMNGTVGFQINVTRIEANYKLSQNRGNEDYHNIMEHLNERDDEMSHRVAEAMKDIHP
jgi:transcriptional regulator